MSPDRIRDEDVLRDDVRWILVDSHGNYLGEYGPEPRRVCENTLGAWLDRDWDSKRGR